MGFRKTEKKHTSNQPLLSFKGLLRARYLKADLFPFVLLNSPNSPTLYSRDQETDSKNLRPAQVHMCGEGQSWKKPVPGAHKDQPS